MQKETKQVCNNINGLNPQIENPNQFPITINGSKRKYLL